MDYRVVVSDLEKLAKESPKEDEKYWAPAKQTVTELQRRYDQALETLRRCRKLRSITQDGTPVGEPKEAQYSKAPKAA